MPDTEATRAAIAQVWRAEAPRVIGCLARIVRDVSLAEELAQDALVAALEAWPSSGVPDRPGAWLVTTAKHRALSWLRRAKLAARTGEALGHEAGPAPPADLEAALAEKLDDDLGDDALRLIFTACHPI